MSTAKVETGEQTAELDEQGFNKSTRKNIHCIDPRRIKVNPNNKRVIDVNTVDFQEFVLNIKVNGLQVPVKITQNPEFGQITKEFPDGDPYEYIVYAGNRRLTAVQYLIAQGVDIKTIDTTVEKKVSLEAQLLMQLVENKNEPFTALEKAEVIRELIEVCSWTPKQVSDRTGESTVTISNMLAVTKFPQKLKNLIEKNAINDKLALQIVRESENETELTEKITALENQAQAIVASGAKRTSRALITESNAADVLVKKKPMTILETVAAQLEEDGVSNEKTELLFKVIKMIQKQSKNTIPNMKKLFKD